MTVKSKAKALVFFTTLAHVRQHSELGWRCLRPLGALSRRCVLAVPNDSLPMELS